MPSPPPRPGVNTTGRRRPCVASYAGVVSFVEKLVTYPKLRLVPVLCESRHAQLLLIRVLVRGVVRFFFFHIVVSSGADDPGHGSGSRGGPGLELLKRLSAGVLFGVELGQRGQGVTREASAREYDYKSASWGLCVILGLGGAHGLFIVKRHRESVVERFPLSFRGRLRFKDSAWEGVILVMVGFF